MKKLVLIDGNALMHRAYHAMPGLTNTQGEPVGAVYGFFGMLLNVIQDQKPDHFIVCFDRSKPTVRQSMYAGYHAHRPSMESDLTEQVSVIDDILEKSNITISSAEGYEGDDVIGTYATQAQEEKDLEVVVVTGDRDMLQLVSDRVKILMTVTGITKTMLYDAQAVEEKYGVTPAQFIDYKALIGDPSDGYPGITGIGPKTASSLLQQFGTFENLYHNIQNVPEKVGVKLATDAEQGALAKKLAAIITDAPVHLEIDKCRVEDIDFETMREEFEKHSFRTLLARLDARYPRPVKPKKEKKKEKENEDQLGLL